MGLNGEFRGCGLTTKSFKLLEDIAIKEGVRCIRVDTDPSNKRMQHVLEKNGYKYCGIIAFEGSDKLAYDKIF